MVAVGDLLLFGLGCVGVFGCGFPVCVVCYSSRFDLGLFVIDFVWVCCLWLWLRVGVGLLWGLFDCVLLLARYEGVFY